MATIQVTQSDMASVVESLSARVARLEHEHQQWHSNWAEEPDVSMNQSGQHNVSRSLEDDLAEVFEEDQTRSQELMGRSTEYFRMSRSSSVQSRTGEGKLDAAYGAWPGEAPNNSGQARIEEATSARTTSRSSALAVARSISFDPTSVQT